MSRYQKDIAALDRACRETAVEDAGDDWRCGEPVVGPRGPRGPMVPCVLERGHGGWHSRSPTGKMSDLDTWRVCYEDRQGREECAIVHAEHKGAALRAFMMNHRGKFRRVLSVD